MTASAVQNHYTYEGIRERLESMLQELTPEGKPLTAKDLTPLDQFHAGGIECTQRLAAKLQVKPDDHVLDVGSGLGGPARFLATNFGCNVTGIELTPLFIEIANYLTDKTNLTDKVKFIEGDALNMPFEDEYFDHAWTQHVAMNIEDKATLYKRVARVLKKGATFGIFDVVAGPNEPILYPVPWAYQSSYSFVVPAEEVTDLLAQAGFTIESQWDATEWGIEWFDNMQAKLKMLTEQPRISAPALIGEDSRPAFVNFVKNLKEQRAGLVQIVARKS